MPVAKRFYIETLGCPKNQVDSDKLIGTLLADGMVATDDPGKADLVVVNTCASSTKRAKSPSTRFWRSKISVVRVRVWW